MALKVIKGEVQGAKTIRAVHCVGMYSYTHLEPVDYLVLQYRILGLYSPGELVAVLFSAVLLAGDCWR